MLSRKARVPDLAIVPRWSTMVSRFMPVPLSDNVSVPASLFAISLIFQSLFPTRRSSCVSESNLILLMASDALLISSRRKISRFEYSEWVIRCRSCFSSVLNSSVSAGMGISNENSHEEARKDTKRGQHEVRMIDLVLAFFSWLFAPLRGQ